jgi:gliding motility-associated-like protein
MKPLKIISLVIFIVFLLRPVAGQDVTQPLSPQLENVTVNPFSGFATIKWLPSVSADVGSYVVYTYNSGIAHAVDTVSSPYITEYTHTGSAARYMSVTYVVAAMDSSLNISPLSNSLSTIYLSVVNDTCHSSIELSWTPYNNAGHPADRYEIWLGAQGTTPALYETLTFTDISYGYNSYSSSVKYCFYITASDINGILSAANMQCVTSGKEMVPSWIRTDAIRVMDRTLYATGSYDQATNIQSFNAERFDAVSRVWVTAGTASGINGIISITIAGADTSKINLYRISAVSNCGKAVASSPPVRNIVLVSSVTGTRIDLKWNNPFPSNDADFSVWRDTGNGWAEVAGSISDTIWSEDYSLFASAVSSAAVAYYVTASELDAHADEPFFRSNITLVQTTENIFMPNAFTPNDDGLNDIFIPILTFTPSKYELRIYSRTGVLLFQTSSHGAGWDGRHDDKPMPSGVYLWSLRLTTPSGRSEQRTGTVTILP